MKSSIDWKEPSFLSRTAKGKGSSMEVWTAAWTFYSNKRTTSTRRIALGRGRGESSPEVGVDESDSVVVGVCVTLRCASSPMHLISPCTLLFKKPCFNTIAAPSKPGVRRYRCSQIEHETASVTGDEGMQTRSYTRDKTCARTHAHHHQPCEYRQDCRLHQPHEGTSEGESNTDPH